MPPGLAWQAPAHNEQGTGHDDRPHLDEDDASPAAGEPQQPRDVVPRPLDDVAHGLQVCSDSVPLSSNMIEKRSCIVHASLGCCSDACRLRASAGLAGFPRPPVGTGIDALLTCIVHGLVLLSRP